MTLFIMPILTSESINGLDHKLRAILKFAGCHSFCISGFDFGGNRSSTRQSPSREGKEN
jgi:hypothetical protein